MTGPWLDLVGIGEDGWDGLSPDARAALEAAEVVIGGSRHHGLAPHLAAERVEWPQPFSAMTDQIATWRGRRVAVLVTGDPLWFSAGARIVRALDAGEVRVHPQLSAFQWAAARLGWSLADVETLTVHGRPVSQVVPYFAPGARLLVLTAGADSPGEVAGRLVAAGYGPSRMVVLGALGGPRESRREGTAETWGGEVDPFHVLAVECRLAEGAEALARTGLPDAAFEHDGQMTKRELRALSLAALWPRRGALLWDIGSGCGSVAVEWCRGAPDAAAIGIEPDAARRAMAARNADRLGAARLRLVEGRAPEALAGLPEPDAVFIGGGLSRETVAAARAALRPGGRLVANAVTLESEALLAALHAEAGGTLCRVAVARAEPVGRLRGWRPAMPVTQWAWP